MIDATERSHGYWRIIYRPILDLYKPRIYTNGCYFREKLWLLVSFEIRSSPIQQQISSGWLGWYPGFPMIAYPTPKGSFFHQLCKGNLQCCWFFPSSFSGIQSGHGFCFRRRFKKTVKNGTREETVPTFWRAGGSTDRLNFRSSFLKRCTWNLRSNFFFWTFWTKMFRWIPSQCLYVLSVSAFNLPTEIDFRSSQNHRDFYRKVGDIKWHDLNFDPTKNGRELGSCWYVHVNKPGSPQLWEQLTPEEKWWVNERKLERQLKKTGAKKKVFFLLRKFRWPLLHLFPLLDTFNLSTMNVWLLV